MFLSHLTQSSKRKLAGGLLATTLALTGGVAVVGAANSAASPTGQITPSQSAKGTKHADGTLRKDELQAVAKQLNISEKQLKQDLKSGKSLADEAAAHNITVTDLKATLRATLKTDLDKAVAAKKIDQAKEDKALAAFDKHADTLINRHHGTKTK